MLRPAFALGAGMVLGLGTASAATVTYTDLRYSDAGARNVLDLHVADESGESPLLVFLHGGAWRAGDKSAVQGAGLDRFLDAGVSVAAMNYRLSQQATWPAQLEDLENAFAFLRQNADTYGYDAGRIGAFGQSAGAHLAAIAGTALSDDPATRLDTVVTQYAPVDFAKMDADAATTEVESLIDHSAPGSPESQLIGAPVGENPELAYQASPLSFLEQLADGAELPSFLLQHGKLDPLVAYPQSERLHAGIMAQGGSPRTILELLPEGTHGGGSFEDPATIERVVGFVSDELGATPPLAPIPLPASLPLVLLGTGALAGLRLRRRA